MRAAAQRAKFAEKVHKPPLRINVNNFELDGFNASMTVLQTPKSCDVVIEDKIRYVYCVKISCMFAPILLY